MTSAVRVRSRVPPPREEMWFVEGKPTVVTRIFVPGGKAPPEPSRLEGRRGWKRTVFPVTTREPWAWTWKLGPMRTWKVSGRTLEGRRAPLKRTERGWLRPTMFPVGGSKETTRRAPP